MKSKTIIFGKWEATALLLNTMASKIFLNYPRNLAESSGAAGWIQVIFGTVLALLSFIIIEKLYARFEGKDILDIAQQSGGIPVRIITGVILLLQVIYITPIVLREYAENMKIVALTISPLGFVSAFFIIGSVVAAYAGIEAIARFNAIAIPIAALAYMSIQIGVLPYFDTANLYPLLGNGVDKILVSGFFTMSSYSAMVSLLFITPFLKTYKTFKSTGYLALGLTAFFLIIGAVVYIGVYPYPTSTEFFLPTYQLARMINFGRFFQRVESVFFIMWGATALMYISFTLYIMTFLFKKTFNLQYRKPLVLPFALLLLNLSFLPESSTRAIELEGYFGYFGWIPTFPMIIILLLIARFVNKSPKGGKSNNE